ncbi:hypothetical protein EKO04_010720 [Ascochyta lentis]|uniref:Prolyl 4-hydroxylase alpha subunit domain-containing protein n=1 Tax=Ascochyta lentis TaxID=205686 RepID=A0A8H7IVI8_9PLEO|nr:hypothetical protein EKO04_010720 [Ascochyta lentis]
MAKDGKKSASEACETTVASKKIGSIGRLTFLLGVGALSAYVWARGSDRLPSTTCPAGFPNPSVKILSIDPFIAHITDFISPSERTYLMDLGSPLLAPSTIVDETGKQASGSSYRTSSTAFLPFSDPCVDRITRRAADFQGFMRFEDMNIQITAYQPGQQYKRHYDWLSHPPHSSTRNTISTFFAILHATCSDCGTEFPLINTTARPQYDKRWCEVIDCDKPVLTTRNVEGSALFWINLDAEGRGRQDTLHAGLPANGGEKIGLNIWTDCEVGEIWDRGMYGGSLKPPVLGTKE